MFPNLLLLVLFLGSVLSAPVLTAFPPSHTEQGGGATLLCLSHQSGPFAEVSWFADGTEVNSGVWSSSAVQKPQQMFHMSSSLSVSMSHWNSHKVYTCRVSVGSSSTEAHISKSQCGGDWSRVHSCHIHSLWGWSVFLLRTDFNKNKECIMSLWVFVLSKIDYIKCLYLWNF